ncbi:MAG: hypothetical protein JMDDDDMK_01927 [Acidobacteria bacterium]|nr:hypothetical protein [Acidobacteriota bacterium]
MSKTWVIVLSIIGGLFLLAIIAGAGVIYWVSQNKDNWIQSAERVGKEAKEFGAKTDSAGCLKEALARHKRDSSLTGQISTKIFLGICLQESEPAPGFCDDVPAKNEIMKSVNWTLKKCADEGLQNDQSCQRLFNDVQEYCHRSNQ